MGSTAHHEEPGVAVLLRTSELWIRAGEAYRSLHMYVDSASGAQADTDVLPGRFSASFVASGKLSAEYDAARALSLLCRSGEVHVHADYALLRVTIVASALAWWVCRATEGIDRRRRALLIQLDDLNQAVRREEHAVTDAQTPRARSPRNEVLERVRVRREELFNRAARIQITLSSRDQSNPIRMRQMLREAQRSLLDVDDVAFTLSWAIASSTAHGSLSAAEQVTERRDGEPDVGWRNPLAVATFAVTTAELLNAAHQCWLTYARVSGLTVDRGT